MGFTGFSYPYAGKCQMTKTVDSGKRPPQTSVTHPGRSAKVQVAYYDLRSNFMAPNETMPKIDFLEEDGRSKDEGDGGEAV